VDVNPHYCFLERKADDMESVSTERHKQLIQASFNKSDEFYTQLTDIEKELKHYRDQFAGKVIYCNCDTEESNFWLYFKLNFDFLKIKKVIATNYDENGNAYKIEKTSKNEKKIKLKGNGDFSSKECINILKKADIIITNPPFSLFRKFINLLIEYNKKFLIIGNVNAITYKDIFPLIKDNKLWLGYSIHSGGREFKVPDNYPLKASGCRVDISGSKFISVKGVRWYTNLDYKEKHQNLLLYKKYNEKEFKKFDSYDAINVNKTCDIPYDYEGYMGVPITFMDKYNPDQFDIIDGLNSNAVVNGKATYFRIVIKNKKPTK
jgi:hypothetical protein